MISYIGRKVKLFDILRKNIYLVLLFEKSFVDKICECK